MTAKKAVKTISFIMIAMLLSKVLGLIRGSFIAGYYGTGVEATAFNSVSNIPLTLFDLAFGAAVTSSFVPVFSTYIKENKRDEAFLFASRFINLIFLCSLIFTIIGIIFSDFIVNIYLLGNAVSPQVKELSTQLIKILFPIAICSGIAFSFISILQSLGEFNIPALVSLIPNLLIILYLVVYEDRFGVYGLSIAFLVGWVLQVIIQIPFLKKMGYRYSLSLSLKDSGLRQMYRLAPPILVGSWHQPVTLILLTSFSSFISDSVIASINYAHRIYLIIAVLITYSLVNYLFPSLSRIAGENSNIEFKKLFNKALNALLFFAVPLFIGAFLFRNEIISIIYQRGEFLIKDTLLTGSAFAGLTLGILGLSVYEITTKAFYAQKKVKIPMFSSLLVITLTFLFWNLSVLLFKQEVFFITSSLSISLIIADVYLLRYLNKYIPGILNFNNIKEFLRSVISSLFMAIIIIAVKKIFFENLLNFRFLYKIIVTGLISGFGFILYVSLMMIFKSETLFYLKSIIKKTK